MEIISMTQGQTASGPQTAAPAAAQHFYSYDVAMDAHEFEMLVRLMEMLQRIQVSELERLNGVGIARHELLRVWTYLSDLNGSLLVDLETLRARYSARMCLTTVAVDEYYQRHQQNLDSAT
jgi:hypothetical protein